MKTIKSYDQFRDKSDIPTNWIDIKKELDDKSYYLDYDEIIYAFSDLVDEGVIEVSDIIKRYVHKETTKTTGGVVEKVHYTKIIYDISIKILDMERVGEYFEYRDGHARKLLKDYYRYDMLNNWSKDFLKGEILLDLWGNFIERNPVKNIDKFELYSIPSVWTK